LAKSFKWRTLPDWLLLWLIEILKTGAKDNSDLVYRYCICCNANAARLLRPNYKLDFFLPEAEMFVEM